MNARAAPRQVSLGLDRPGHLVTLAKLWIAAWLAVTVAVTVWTGLTTIAARPLDYVEGELSFDASRLRDHIALYTDPIVGVRAPGALPVRFYVPYVPAWARLVAWMPAEAAKVGGRLVAAAAFATLFAAALGSPGARGRWAPRAFAAFFAGTATVANYGFTARPDVPATAFAAIAFARTLRAARVDVVSGLLLAAAFVLKPSVVGIAMGTFAVALARDRPRALPGIAACAAAITAIVGALDAATGGTFLVHALRSSGQPFDVETWSIHVVHKLDFFLLPLALPPFVAALAARDPSRAAASIYALGGYTTSVAACVIALAKGGSSENYWLEPFAAGLVVVAELPFPKLGARGLAVLLAALAVQVPYTGVASLLESARVLAWTRDAPAWLAGVRARCRPTVHDLVASDDLGLEMELDNRILTTPFTMTFLVLRGAFPPSVWIDDLRDPRVRCFVTTSDVLERPTATLVRGFDRLPPVVANAIRDAFVLVDRGPGLRLYARR